MWNRLLWGVEFIGRGDPMLIGENWTDTWNVKRHDGEPPRALLFCTRQQARDWCDEKNSRWRKQNGIVSKWRVRPVRVRETVVIVEGGGKT